MLSEGVGPIDVGLCEWPDDPETRIARSIGLGSASLGCLAALAILLVIGSGALLEAFALPVWVGFIVACALGWGCGPFLRAGSGRRWAFVGRGVLLALFVVVAGTTAGTVLQLMLDPSLRGKADPLEWVLMIDALVVMVGGLPAVALGCGAGLHLRKRLRAEASAGRVPPEAA